MQTRREKTILFGLGLLSGAALGLPLWLFPPVLATPIATAMLVECAVTAVALVGRWLWEGR